MKWLRNRNQRPKPLTGLPQYSDNKLLNGNTSNHIVRNLYDSTSTIKKPNEIPEDQITNIIEEKIDKLKSSSAIASTSGTSSQKSRQPVHLYSENSRSSIKSLLECFYNGDTGENNDGNF